MGWGWVAGATDGWAASAVGGAVVTAGFGRALCVGLGDGECVGGGVCSATALGLAVLSFLACAAREDEHPQSATATVATTAATIAGAKYL